MKVFSTIVLSVVLVGGMVGCGKTLAELRTNGDAVVDNATGAASGILSTVGTIAKKVIGAGFAIYDIGKKIYDDTTDNVGTVTGGVVGTTPTK
jgi:hypothetical protein